MFIFRKFKFYLIKKLKNRLFQNFILIAVISTNGLIIHIFFKHKSCSLGFQQHSQAKLVSRYLLSIVFPSFTHA